MTTFLSRWGLLVPEMAEARMKRKTSSLGHWEPTHRGPLNFALGQWKEHGAHAVVRELWHFFLGRRSTDMQSASGSRDTQVLRDVQTEGHLVMEAAVPSDLRLRPGGGSLSEHRHIA